MDFKGNKYICSLIDARNDNVYCGLFNSNHDMIGKYTADHIDNIITSLPKDNIVFVGNGSIIHKEKILNTFHSLASFSDNNS